jgi:hypothetical protein
MGYPFRGFKWYQIRFDFFTKTFKGLFCVAQGVDRSLPHGVSAIVDMQKFDLLLPNAVPHGFMAFIYHPIITFFALYDAVDAFSAAFLFCTPRVP